jgi:phage gp36-like protein
MAYALQADIEARYPGELAQAGPRGADGELDAAAIALACNWASATVDRYLRAIGWPVPLADDFPAWIVDLTVDLALYQATPTALASQADFSDRHVRYVAALTQLDAIARGEISPPTPADGGALLPVYVTSNSRVFGAGVL